MAEQGIRPQPYPYRIPHARCPDPATIKKLDRWNVQEFIRIELLLRSQTVKELYNTEGASWASTIKLIREFGFRWNVLEGAHHNYLLTSIAPINALPGFTVLTPEELLKSVDVLDTLVPTGSDTEKKEIMGRFFDRVLCLLIDPNLPPKKVLSVLRLVLEKRYNKNTVTSSKKPRKFDISRWLKYLACYDFRAAEKLPYGTIAQRVYNKTGAAARDQAKKAVRRVQLMINAAEHGNWPPKG